MFLLLILPFVYLIFKQILPPHLGGTSALYGSNPLQNEHIVTTLPVTVTDTTSSTIQDSKELNDADIRGVGSDLIDKEMEMEMVEVMTVEEAVRIEEEEESSSGNVSVKEMFSVSNSDTSAPQHMINIVTESNSESDSGFLSPVIHSSTVTVDRFDRLESTLMTVTVTTADRDTIGGEKILKTTYVNSNSNNVKNRLSVDNGLDNIVCVGVCVGVSVTVSPNTVRGGRDSDVRAGMVGPLSSSDRTDLRTLTNNNSNNNMNKNHYTTSGYDNNNDDDDINDVNNNDNSDHNEYNDDREMKNNLGAGVDQYYSKGLPLNQDLRDSRRDFLDTIMA